MKGRAADAKDLVLSTKSCSDPITSLGLMMSQSSITGPAEKENSTVLINSPVFKLSSFSIENKFLD